MGYRANRAQKVPTVWLLRTMAKGMTKLAKQPAATVYRRPQVVAPNRSTSRANRTRKMAKGRALIVSRMVRTTAKGCSTIDQPNASFSNQYSPARSNGKRGGLLE